MLKEIYLSAKRILHNPYKGILDFKEFKRIRDMPRYVPGVAKVLNKDICFSDNNGFLCSIKEIFLENQVTFDSDNLTPLIVDCGSNIGLSIIYLKTKFPNAEIIGFEPDPNIFSLLEKNIKTFNLENITLNKAAVWDEDTELNFFSDGSLAGSLELDVTKRSINNVVKATRLKSILKEKNVEFLKIDIEGSENTVLFDIKEELKNVKYFFLEYHSIYGKEQNLGEIINIIKSAGFNYYIKNSNDYLNFPFIDKPNEGFDLQLCIYCYRKSLII